MRVKSWYVPPGLWLAAIIVSVLFAGSPSPAAEPEDVEPDFGETGSLATLEKLAEAGESYTHTLEATPDDWGLQFLKGFFLALMGKSEEALASYDRAFELYEGGFPSVLLDPDVGEEEVRRVVSTMYFARANVLYELGRFEESLACYDEAIKSSDGKYPDLSYAVYERKIKVLTDVGRLGEAVDIYDEILALKPDDSSKHYEKGEILIELGRLKEAVESFDRAIELYEGEDAYPIFNLNEAYEDKIRALEELGRLEDALETYDEALTRFPEDEDLARGKGDVLLKLGRCEEAVASYEEALIGDRDYSYDELIEVGQREYGGHNYIEAITYLSAAARYKPKFARLYEVIGGLWRDLGHEEIAVSYLERAEELELEIERSYIEPGEECFARGEYEKAASYFGTAAAHYPTHGFAATMEGAALTLAGKYDEALECFEPDWGCYAMDESQAWLAAAGDLLWIGETEAMLRCLERARELEPGIMDVWVARGVAYFMLDDYARARTAFEEDLNEYGNNGILLWLYLVDRADGRSGLERLRPLLESRDGAWERDKARFLAGEMDAEDLLAKAGNNKSLLCEAHCYIGYKYKFDGDAAAACRHFEEAVTAAGTGDTPYPEYGLARRELRRLGIAGK